MKRLITHDSKDKEINTTILLIEDNEQDGITVKLAFEELGLPANLVQVNDGMEALEFLHKKNEFSNVNLPDLILLDLDLPEIDGLELLDKIKEDVTLKNIPTVMFTTSTNHIDIRESYENSANAYILKPSNFANSLDVFRKLNERWLGLPYNSLINHES